MWNRLDMGPLMEEAETGTGGGAKKEEAKKEEAKKEAPSAPPGPALSPRSLRGLSAKEVEVMMAIARDDRLPLAVRKELLGGNVPEQLLAPDRGWGDRAAAAAQAGLLAVIGVAAGMAALVVIVSSAKALLTTMGVLTPEPTALPPAGQQLHLPPTASGAGGGGLCGSSFRPSGGGCRFSSESATLGSFRE